MAKIFSKRTLYAICGLLLMLIDWSRNVQPGAIWTVNCVGCVLAVVALSAFPVRNYRKTSFFIWAGVTVTVTIVLAILGIPALLSIPTAQYLSAAAAAWLLGMAWICIRESGDKFRISKWEIPVLVLFSCMFFSVNEDVWPLLFLAVYFTLRHTPFDKESRQFLATGMTDGIIAGYLILQGLAFVFRPYDSPVFRYTGIYSNINMNALFYLVVWIALMFRLYELRKASAPLWKKGIILVLSASAVGFIVLTITRTAWLALLGLGLVYVILADAVYLRDSFRVIVKRLLLFGVLSAIAFPICYASARYLPAFFHHPIWFAGEYDESRVHSFDAADSDKYVSWEEVTDTLGERMSSLITVIGGTNSYVTENVSEQGSDRTFVEENSNYDVSGYIRLEMLKYYIPAATWVGHSNADGHTPGFYGTDWYIWHTQNVFVQIWYYFGIPAGILFLVCMAVCFYRSITDALRGSREALLVLLYGLLFLGFGLLEVVWIPGQMVFTMLLLGTSVLLVKDISNEKVIE